MKKEDLVKQRESSLLKACQGCDDHIPVSDEKLQPWGLKNLNPRQLEQREYYIFLLNRY